MVWPIWVLDIAAMNMNVARSAARVCGTVGVKTQIVNTIGIRKMTTRRIKMIPRKTQSRPNVWPKHFCSVCNYRLEDGKTRVGNVIIKQWNFCPICGEQIEWEKVEPVVWHDLNCDTCGVWLIRHDELSAYASSDYIGTNTCRICQMAFCARTNCLDCDGVKEKSGSECEFTYLKQQQL